MIEITTLVRGTYIHTQQKKATATETATASATQSTAAAAARSLTSGPNPDPRVPLRPLTPSSGVPVVDFRFGDEATMPLRGGEELAAPLALPPLLPPPASTAPFMGLRFDPAIDLPPP